MKLRNGWNIDFQKNIHMYCHSLIVKKGNKQYEVPCEDTPTGSLGIWLYEIGFDETTLSDLQASLTEWAKSAGLTYRIYNTPDAWVTNRS